MATISPSSRDIASSVGRMSGHPDARARTPSLGGQLDGPLGAVGVTVEGVLPVPRPTWANVASMAAVGSRSGVMAARSSSQDPAQRRRCRGRAGRGQRRRAAGSPVGPPLKMGAQRQFEVELPHGRTQRRNGHVTRSVAERQKGRSPARGRLGGVASASRGPVLLAGTELVGMKPFEIAQLGVGRSFQTASIPCNNGHRTPISTI